MSSISGFSEDRFEECRADEVLSSTKQDTDKVEEHCGECGAMDHVDEKMDGRKKFSGKQAKKDNEDRRAPREKS